MFFLIIHQGIVEQTHKKSYLNHELGCSFNKYLSSDNQPSNALNARNIREENMDIAAGLIKSIAQRPKKWRGTTGTATISDTIKIQKCYPKGYYRAEYTPTGKKCGLAMLGAIYSRQREADAKARCHSQNVLEEELFLLCYIEMPMENVNVQDKRNKTTQCLGVAIKAPPQYLSI